MVIGLPEHFWFDGPMGCCILTALLVGSKTWVPVIVEGWMGCSMTIRVWRYDFVAVLFGGWGYFQLIGLYILIVTFPFPLVFFSSNSALFWVLPHQIVSWWFWVRLRIVIPVLQSSGMTSSSWSLDSHDGSFGVVHMCLLCCHPGCLVKWPTVQCL